MKTVVRWGIIGAGNVCDRKSGPPLYQVPRSELRTVFRRDRAGAESFVNRHGHGEVVSTYDEMLNDAAIDAVYVATPHELHAEHTIKALEAGKHVLVEKPMALSTAECDAMISAAAKAQRSLAVAYYRRGYPSVALAARLARDGTLGTPRLMAINGEFPTSHRIDIVHFLFGPIESIHREPGRTGTGYRFEQMMPRIEAHCASGPIVTMMEQWTETGMPEAFIVEGTNASLSVYDLKGGVAALRPVQEDAARAAAGDEPDAQDILYPGTLPWTHWGLVDNFVSHLLDGVPLMCDGVAGRASTVVLETIDAAGSRRGERLAVKY